MGFVVVIPARYTSTRLPGKPLLMIAGKPMIQHVYERACASGARAVYIATDSADIAEVAATFTDNVCMTGEHHQSGTDRIQEVTAQLALHDDDVVVNVQGDEPLIEPALIDQVAEDLLLHGDAGLSSLYEPLHSLEDLCNPNVVKVVTDELGYALYFSRSPVPWQGALAPREDDSAAMDNEPEVIASRHIGIYAYRVVTLNRFTRWPQSILERSERLEQLRALSQGVRIHMSMSAEPVHGGVDTQADLDRIRRLLQQAD